MSSQLRHNNKTLVRAEDDGGCGQEEQARTKEINSVVM